jgi:hypothetical protein
LVTVPSAALTGCRTPGCRTDLAGATAGIKLLRPAAPANATSPTSNELQQLTAEIEAERDALRDIMASLAAPVRRYKLVTNRGSHGLPKRMRTSGFVMRSEDRLTPNLRLELLLWRSLGSKDRHRGLRVTCVCPYRAQHVREGLGSRGSSNQGGAATAEIDERRGLTYSLPAGSRRVMSRSAARSLAAASRSVPAQIRSRSALARSCSSSWRSSR